MAGHDGGHVLVPCNAEEAGADGSEHVVVHEGTSGEGLARLGPFHGVFVVDGDIIFVLKEDDGDSVIGGALHGCWREPWEQHLGV